MYEFRITPEHLSQLAFEREQRRQRVMAEFQAKRLLTEIEERKRRADKDLAAEMAER